MSTRASRKSALWQQIFSVRLSGLIVIVAGCALVIEAWKYHRDNLDPDRATTTFYLRRLAGGPDRVEAAHALCRVRGQEVRRVVPALIDAMGDRDKGVRAAATEAVGRLIEINAPLLQGEVADEIAAARPRVIAALDDKEALVRRAAVRALPDLSIPRVPPTAMPSGVVTAPGYGPLGPDPKTLRPLVERATRDPDPWVREASMWSYVRLHRPRDDVPEGVFTALKSDTSWDVRAAAAQALSFLWRENPLLMRSAETPSLIPALTTLAARNDAFPQRSAISCLTQLCPITRPAIAGLRDSPNPTVRKWARTQLETFDRMDRAAASAEAEYRKSLTPDGGSSAQP
jgi:hypothetical protein